MKKSPNKKPWTQEEIEQLKLLAQKNTTPKICEILGRSHDEVRYQLRKNGISTHVPWERAFEELSAIYRYSDNHGCKEAAKHFGLSVEVVKNIRRRYMKEVKKFGQSISEGALQRLRKLAMAYAGSKGRAEYAEDFASYCTIYRLTHRSLNLEWAFVNFLRETFGNTRTGSGSLETRSNLHGIPISEEPFNEDGSPAGIQIEDTEQGGDSIAALRLADELHLKEIDRAIFILYFHFGFLQREIGQVFGISESRVNQIMKALFIKLKKRGLNTSDI